jgi:hypothetical protein
VNDLYDDLALRIRHNAAMDTVDELAGERDRYDLLWSVVVCPSPALRDASLKAAHDQLNRRACREPAAA